MNVSNGLKESEGGRMLQAEGEAGTRAGRWGQLLWEKAGRLRSWMGFASQCCEMGEVAGSGDTGCIRLYRPLGLTLMELGSLWSAVNQGRWCNLDLNNHPSSFLRID